MEGEEAFVKVLHNHDNHCTDRKACRRAQFLDVVATLQIQSCFYLFVHYLFQARCQEAAVHVDTWHKPIFVCFTTPAPPVQELY